MKNTRAEELMAAYLSGNIRPDEKTELMSWVTDEPSGQTFFDKSERLWEATEEMDYPDFGTNKSAAWEKVAQRTAKPAVQPVRQAKVRRLVDRRWLSIAAGAAILIMATWWWQNGTTPVEVVPVVASTVVGERQELTLPDGTQVWLNETSEITYEDRADERFVAFSGEAYFDVATDSLRPFRIYTPDAVTTVLGTSFNLRAYPEEETVELSVTEGKVAMNNQPRELEDTPNVPVAKPQEVVVTAGKEAVLTREDAKIEEKVAAVNNATAWKERKLNFPDIPLVEVIPTLERYFDVQVKLENPGLAKCYFNLENLLNPEMDVILQWMIDTGTITSFKQEGNTYMLVGPACN